ncbi:ferrous iron transport protein B [Acidithiobacillus caldus]|uniref:Ferrous iron transport protein B n=2 Tax=Acidithiobacillus caldus TaxID=33059 RepID=F9ZSN5_ACICS|nr:ferrous iron transport protein B [Acidithiobacillus caldus]AEK56926.1 Ferrous iron transport protein B [Acidithiobacillus caldus SM-1]AUW31724.1 ferrous iron transport protein B [Acidithiobacillus caldus]QER44014.1 Fe2+ transport system protein B [Acidithiobacillus caldus]
MSHTAMVGARGGRRIALVGNPNSGKTTLFNALTGAHQQVGNWPGVTVERREGRLRLDSGELIVVDLPGVYSLLGGGGVDQDIARAYVQNAQLDGLVQVVDVGQLQRHLLLTHELLHLGRPLLLVLNMMDEARARSAVPDLDRLRQRLGGIAVLPMVARRGEGLAQLREALERDFPQGGEPVPALYPAELAHTLAQLAAQTPTLAALDRLRILEGLAPPPTDAEPHARRAREEIRAKTGEDAADALAAARFAWAEDTARAVLPATTASAKERWTQRLDRWILHPVTGVPIFLGVLYALLVASFNAGAIFQDFFEDGSKALLVHGLGHLLLDAGLPDWSVQALAGGFGGGVSIVLSFVPPIAFTFLFLAALEDSGYLARAAFVMDRFFRHLGLPGTAMVPMVIGFGCNVPAILATRTIEDPRARVIAALMQPFMSCSARLAVYLAFAAVFFRGYGGQVVFALYLTGILVAVLTAWLLRRGPLPGAERPLALELPPYRWPGLRSVALHAWHRLRVFVMRVGKVIAVLGAILLLLPGIGWVDGGLRSTDMEHSLLAQGSRTLTVVFAPMGIGTEQWPAVAGLVAGALVKEVVIGVMNGIYQRQGETDLMTAYRDPDLGAELRAALATIPAHGQEFLHHLTDPLGFTPIGDRAASAAAAGADEATLKGLAAGFTDLSAFAYLLFVLLYLPCASTFAALRREIGRGWAWFSVFYGLATAWIAAGSVYQLGTFARHPGQSLAWLAMVLALIALFWWQWRRYGRRVQGKTPSHGLAQRP